MFPCQQMPYLNNIAYCNDTPHIVGLTSNLYQLETPTPFAFTFHPILSTTEGYEFTYDSTDSNTTEDNEEECEEEPETKHETKKSKASVFPAKNFDPKKDAEVLAKALTELGTDEDTIIKVLTKRSFEQRKQIALTYKSWLGMNLMDDLGKEVSGKLKYLVLALMTPVPQFYALELRNAMRGVGTNEGVLIEILCTLTNTEMAAVKSAYVKMFERQLAADIHGDTSGNFRKLLITLCEGKRSEDSTVNILRAKHLAKKLLRAGEQRAGNEPAVFTWILSSMSYPQLTEVFRQYHALAGHSINDAIQSEFRGVMRSSYETIVKSILNKSMYFAEVLYRSMKGIGTNDKQLVRVIVTRSEIDLAEITAQFPKLYGTRLDTWIEDDCSGLYKKCLLSLIGSSAQTSFD